MRPYKVGILGGTGMVGQRFVSLLQNHPWFTVECIAASPRSAGMPYEEAVLGRWAMPEPVPEAMRRLVVLDATADMKQIASGVDFCFSAVEMPGEEIRALEEGYAGLECPVISNNSAHRHTPDVPMVIPEVNPEHLEVIGHFRKRSGLSRGFIVVKSNCSLQSYLPALHPLHIRYGLEKVLVCTYQAISGAGKTFESWPQMVDNVIPYIGGEEEKSEREPLKIWGHVHNGVIVNAPLPDITSQCVRVPVTDGHLAAVFASFEEKPHTDEIMRLWRGYEGIPQKLALPSAPKRFLHCFTEPDRPQTALDRDLENGMAVSVGRLREDTQYHIKFVSLSHNTLRGAAGGGVLMAELLCAQGYID